MNCYIYFIDEIYNIKHFINQYDLNAAYINNDYINHVINDCIYLYKNLIAPNTNLIVIEFSKLAYYDFFQIKTKLQGQGSQSIEGFI